jgi:very-short-patch-repair endonuclease
MQHSAVWRLVERQHGVIARRQLLELGFSAKAIEHRLQTGRLHLIRRGVYAVGRPQRSDHALLVADVLACGAGAVASHTSAAAVWGIVERFRGPRHVTVVRGAPRSTDRLIIHRRPAITGHTTTRHNIPVTKPVLTLIDLAMLLTDDELEAAVNAADQRDLVDPERLRSALKHHQGRPGVARLRRLLDHHTRADSPLERRFLRLVRAASLPEPLTQQWLVDQYRVDFLWPDHDLVIETDSLTYHRTAATQGKDIRRDQDLLTAGYTVLRFTHAQVTTDPAHVTRVLREVLSARDARAPRRAPCRGRSSSG